MRFRIARFRSACEQARVNGLSETPAETSTGPKRPFVLSPASRLIKATPGLSPLVKIGLGLAVGCIAVIVRSFLPLNPQQLPTITVVIGTAVTTTFVGVRAGSTCAIIGGIGCWYYFFNPRSWSLANGSWIPLLGFTIIAGVIISTSFLYRRSEQQAHRRELEEIANAAETAQLFASELAHRLKNTLTIVQALTLQTLDSTSPRTEAFNDRLRALATGNDLLSHHVSNPSAKLSDIARAIVAPFADNDRVRFQGVDIRLPSSEVITLALAFHELATNATKYGALSVPTGTLTISSEDRGGRIRLTWEEQGGPPVEPPQRRGFGTRLLRRAGMNTQLEFASAGVRCSFEIRQFSEPGP